jgi:hypothetical protein
MLAANLGDKVRDELIGVEGIVITVGYYLTGKSHYLVQPQMKKGDKIPEKPQWVEHDQIKVIKKGDQSEIPLRDIDLGDRIIDVTSNFRGIVTARSEWINGCPRILVRAPLNFWQRWTGQTPEEVWIDENLCKVVKRGVLLQDAEIRHKIRPQIQPKLTGRTTGGPMPSIPTSH